MKVVRKWGDNELNDAGLTRKAQEFIEMCKEFVELFKIIIIVAVTIGTPLFGIWGITKLLR